MRLVEFSRDDLRERHATIRELTSQVQELQERMNFMNGCTALPVAQRCNYSLLHMSLKGDHEH